MYLVFSSTNLINMITSCRLREDLKYSCDYYPIETSFLLASHITLYVPKLLQKRADKDALAQKVRELDLMLRTYRTCKDIDARMEELGR